MHTVSLKPTTSPSTSHLQGREVLVELEPIGIQFDVIRYMSSSLNSLGEIPSWTHLNWENKNK